MSWTGSILKDMAIEELLKAATISSPNIGDGPSTQSQGGGKLSGSAPPPEENAQEEAEEEKKIKQTVKEQLKRAMPQNGWFQSMFGRDAEAMVKELRSARRIRKDLREDIDLAIDAIRIAKREEVEETINELSWSDDHLSSIRSLGVSDRDLMSLRKHGNARGIALKQACIMWEKANDVITKLSQVEGDFNEDQLQLWVNSRQMRKDAKKQWKGTLHPVDNIKKQESIWLGKTVNVLETRGPLSSNEIFNSIGAPKNLTVRKMSALLKTHGIDFNIEKIGSNYGLVENNVVIVKSIWAYAAGFLDADGYVTITKRGEPRAGFIATGSRGKMHCENLHKALGCGVLQTDLKVHKSSTRSQHRLQFYSEDDLRTLLKGVLPHLQMKKAQGHAVLELLDLRGRGSDIVKSRREELYRVVKWENWKDVPNEREKLLRQWKVDESEVLTWGQRDSELIQLVDDVERMERVI